MIAWFEDGTLDGSIFMAEDLIDCCWIWGTFFDGVEIEGSDSHSSDDEMITSCLLILRALSLMRYFTAVLRWFCRGVFGFRNPFAGVFFAGVFFEPEAELSSASDPKSWLGFNARFQWTPSSKSTLPLVDCFLSLSKSVLCLNRKWG